MSKIERVKQRMTPEQRSEMRQVAEQVKQDLPELKKLADEKDPRKLIQVRVTAEMHQALADFCRDQGTELSEFLRETALRKIGRRDLVATMKRGRPKAEA